MRVSCRTCFATSGSPSAGRSTGSGPASARSSSRHSSSRLSRRTSRVRVRVRSSPLASTRCWRTTTITDARSTSPPNARPPSWPYTTSPRDVAPRCSNGRAVRSALPGENVRSADADADRMTLRGFMSASYVTSASAKRPARRLALGNTSPASGWNAPPEPRASPCRSADARRVAGDGSGEVGEGDARRTSTSGPVHAVAPAAAMMLRNARRVRRRSTSSLTAAGSSTRAGARRDRRGGRAASSPTAGRRDPPRRGLPT